MNKFYLLFCLSLSVLAQDTIDERLKNYVTQFGLLPLASPAPSQPALVRLGQKLFFEKALSGNKNISCADCHHPLVDTHDGLPFAVGEGSEGLQTQTTKRMQGHGQMIGRNSPALFNLANIDIMFWDGRVEFDRSKKIFTTPALEISGENPLRADIASTLKSALAAQALFPMADHKEMLGALGSNEIADQSSYPEIWDALVTRLLTVATYQADFSTLFPGETINIGHVAEALAAFEREAFNFNDTPYDRYLKGDTKALTPIQKKGMDVFFDKGKCGNCHFGEQLTNLKFENILTPQFGPGKTENGDDLGRFQWDPKDENRYAFRVPPLRNVAVTAPYMHNGAFKTIAQLVEHYDMPDTSLKAYEFVNNLKNYTDILKGVDHSQDEDRLRHVSKNMEFPREFLEEEEKALAEFLSSSLTDYRILNREIGQDYSTQIRVSLTASGLKKLQDLLESKGAQASDDIYYYFDIFLDGGYFVRELQRPIRLFAIKSSDGTNIFKWKETLFKKASQFSGVTLDGTFVSEKLTPLSDTTLATFETPYLDMFNRLYTYHNGATESEIPIMELGIIKNDLLAINEAMHAAGLEGEVDLSDRTNIAKEKLFYVPTSYNFKRSWTYSSRIQNHLVKTILLDSLLRDEYGAQHKTYAIEFETDQIKKSDFESFTRELSALFTQAGIEAQDLGGNNYSPSLLTEKIIQEVMKE